MSRQHCPICKTEVTPNERYPDYLCWDCAGRATSEDGRSLAFYNVDLGGGFMAQYADTEEPRDSHICFVDGVRCWADEAHMGGIVVRPRG